MSLGPPGESIDKGESHAAQRLAPNVLCNRPKARSAHMPSAKMSNHSKAASGVEDDVFARQGDFRRYARLSIWSSRCWTYPNYYAHMLARFDKLFYYNATDAHHSHLERFVFHVCQACYFSTYVSRIEPSPNTQETSTL